MEHNLVRSAAVELVLCQAPGMLSVKIAVLKIRVVSRNVIAGWN